ncbi:Ferredoxin reductase [Euzebya pacifica]|uniref:Ferredoxin reductase n=1 Tax=Euzebya pacifica TaxID=1608957 RepID=A0A346Y378_9ACTN|nr:FAD-dependent oxidoreductase [Euzebya pacifica]AXV08925.1 Ferredoxin reductase [Euzebya pacifica]
MAGPQVVVVGGGPAAAALVHGLHRGGHEGSVVVLAGEGCTPYDRTAVSKGLLTGEVPTAPELFPEVLTADVVRHADVVEIDRAAREVVTGDDDRIGFDRLVLATGAAPRVPPVPGLDGPHASTLRDAAEAAVLAERLRPGARLVVVGAGLIGLEVAAAARTRGASVTVLEAAPTALSRVLPTVVSEVVLSRHAAEGIDVRLGTPPSAVVSSSSSSGQAVVVLADGTELPADHVLVATGVAPRTDLAAAAGLAVDDGVLVDERLVTSDPAIMAIGDVARVRAADGTTARHEAYTPAMAMGQHAARTILGEPTRFVDVPWSWSDQLDLSIQVAGWPDRADRWVLRGSAEDLDAGLFAFGVRDGRLVAATGVSRGRQVGRIVRGAQALVAAGLDVDDAALADPSTDLRRLARTG